MPGPIAPPAAPGPIAGPPPASVPTGERLLIAEINTLSGEWPFGNRQRVVWSQLLADTCAKIQSRTGQHPEGMDFANGKKAVTEALRMANLGSQPMALLIDHVQCPYWQHARSFVLAVAQTVIC